MKSDWFVKVGRLHEREGGFCQDYCSTVQLSDGGVLLLASDGCSMSSKSDVGARLWVLSAAKMAGKGRALLTMEASDIIDEIRRNVSVVMADMSLSWEDTLATLLMCVSYEEESRFLGWGDGLFGWETEEGKVIAKMDWSANAPPYPSYAVMGHSEAFLSLGQKGALEMGGNIIDVDSSSGLRGWSFRVMSPLVSWIATDGMDSFGRQVERERFLAFKTKTGDFLKRRCLRELSDLSKAGLTNSDDFTMLVSVREENVDQESAS